MSLFLHACLGCGISALLGFAAGIFVNVLQDKIARDEADALRSLVKRAEEEADFMSRAYGKLLEKYTAREDTADWWKEEKSND
jgi:hypothetical protein